MLGSRAEEAQGRAADECRKVLCVRPDLFFIVGAAFVICNWWWDCLGRMDNRERLLDRGGSGWQK